MLIDNSNIDNYIAKLEQQIFDNRKKISILKRVKNKYPKLRLNWDRWNNEYFNTPEINSIADKIDIHYNCSCCSDSSLMLNCFIEFNELKIYGDPFEITIGDTNNREAYVLFKNWEEEVRKENFPDNIIEQIKEFIKAHPQLDLDNE